MQTEELDKKVKGILFSEGISPNAKTLLVNAEGSSLSVEDLERICREFGEVDSTQQKPDGTYVTFAQTTDAYIAKEALQNTRIDDSGKTLQIEWTEKVTSKRVLNFTEVPEVFTPPRNPEAVQTQEPADMEYKGVVKVPIREEHGFLLHQKLLGAKGCNFRKIVEECARDTPIPPDPAHLLRLQLAKQDGYQIHVSSRYREKFAAAMDKIETLVSMVFEEFKRHCYQLGITPPDLRIQSDETITGRAKAFAEGKDALCKWI